MYWINSIIALVLLIVGMVFFYKGYARVCDKAEKQEIQHYLNLASSFFALGIGWLLGGIIKSIFIR